MIGNQIRKLLAATQMSQVELAQKMHVSESKLSKIINGTLEPGITDLKQLSNIFEVSIDELVLGESRENASLLEKSIKSGNNAFNELINLDPTWITKTDDYGKDMAYYIKKHNAYEVFNVFYIIKNLHVPSIDQLYYIKTLTKLIQLKEYDAYKKMIKKNFSWDLSALIKNEQETEKIEDFVRGDNTLIIYEVISKNHKDKSLIQLNHNKETFSSIELENCFIYAYQRKEMEAYFDEILISQMAEPKYLTDEGKHTDYVKIHMASSSETQKEWLLKYQNNSLNLDEKVAFLESLFISKAKDLIWNLFSNHLETMTYQNLNEAKNTFMYKPIQYFRIQTIFINGIKWAQLFFIQCVKYQNKPIFEKLLSHSNMMQLTKCAKQELLSELSGYAFIDVKPKKMDFFDFEMSEKYKQLVKDFLAE